MTVLWFTREPGFITGWTSLFEKYMNLLCQLKIMIIIFHFSTWTSCVNPPSLFLNPLTYAHVTKPPVSRRKGYRTDATVSVLLGFLLFLIPARKPWPSAFSSESKGQIPRCCVFPQQGPVYKLHWGSGHQRKGECSRPLLTGSGNRSSLFSVQEMMTMRRKRIPWPPWSRGKTSRDWCRGRLLFWWEEDTHWLLDARWALQLGLYIYI